MQIPLAHIARFTITSPTDVTLRNEDNKRHCNELRPANLHKSGTDFLTIVEEIYE